MGRRLYTVPDLNGETACLDSGTSVHYLNVSVLRSFGCVLSFACSSWKYGRKCETEILLSQSKIVIYSIGNLDTDVCETCIIHKIIIYAQIRLRYKWSDYRYAMHVFMHNQHVWVIIQLRWIEFIEEICGKVNSTFWKYYS